MFTNVDDVVLLAENKELLEEVLTEISQKIQQKNEHNRNKDAGWKFDKESNKLKLTFLRKNRLFSCHKY